MRKPCCEANERGFSCDCSTRDNSQEAEDIGHVDDRNDRDWLEDAMDGC